MASRSNIWILVVLCINSVFSDQDCGPVPEVPNSTNNATDAEAFPDGTTVIYRCSFGYYLDGSNRYRCHCGVWEGEGTRCIVRTCPFPESRSHQSYEGNDRSVGNRVVFSCEDGYELNGAQVLICRADGEWNTRQPVCEAVQCPDLFARSNVRISRYTSSGQMDDFGVFGSIAEFSCRPGYNGSGSSRRVCQANGQWSGQPFTCTEVDCGPPDVGQGTVENLPATTAGSVGILRCNPGAFSTSESIICRENGQWSQGQCIACPTNADSQSFPYEDRCYIFVSVTRSFSNAKEYCQTNFRGNLVSVLNSGINVFISYQKRQLQWNGDTWIGAEWINGRWEWPNGVMIWSNWDTGEGSYRVVKFEHCAVIAANGKWKDKECSWIMSGSKKFICEASFP